MNKLNPITWKTFKDHLSQHSELDLQFKYAEDKLINAAYHITEIKQATITSVDCGGIMNSWTEIIMQLWVPAGEQQLRPMKVNKALSIADLVEGKLPLNPFAVVKIEFGNSGFDTRQMFPENVIVDGDALTVDLRPDTVQCKAIDRGGSCGINNNGDECCVPEVAEKSEITLMNRAATADCCKPGEGCC